jgi:MSHA pilin protein MshC
MLNAAHLRGFTLVELVAVLVIIGILASVVGSRSMSFSTLSLMGGRDLAVSALFSAQQKAMVQADAVRLITQGSSIDIRVDANADGTFAASESIRCNGVLYPIVAPGGISFSSQIFAFDHLGHTTAGTISVSKGSNSVSVTVTAVGYAY